MDKVIKTIGTALGGCLGFMFGEINGLFYTVIALMVLDYITGVVSAIKRKNLNSNIGYWGIVKKVLMLCIIAVAHIIDVQVIGGGGTLMTATELFFIANDGISILENSAEFGLPVPGVIVSVLEQLKKKGDKDDDSK